MSTQLIIVWHICAISCAICNVHWANHSPAYMCNVQYAFYTLLTIVRHICAISCAICNVHWAHHSPAYMCNIMCIVQYAMYTWLIIVQHKCAMRNMYCIQGDPKKKGYHEDSWLKSVLEVWFYFFCRCCGTRKLTPIHLATSILPTQNQKYPKSDKSACANTQISPQPSEVLLGHFHLCCFQNTCGKV